MRHAIFERVGVLVLRAWIEPGSAIRLRVRITSNPDIRHKDESSIVVTNAEEATAVVTEWLEKFISEQG